MLLSKLKKLIEHYKLLPTKDLTDLIQLAQEKQTNWADLLFSKTKIKPANFLKTLAKVENLNYLEETPSSKITQPFNLIPDWALAKYQLIPFNYQEKQQQWQLATTNFQNAHSLSKLFPNKTQIFLITPEKWEELQKLNLVTTEATSSKNLISFLLKAARYEQATAIHLEEREKHFLIRLRINGQLTNYQELDLSKQLPLVEYCRKLSGISSHKHYQNKELLNLNKELAVHISIMPLLSGYKIVLNLQSLELTKINLDTIGLDLNSIAKIKRTLDQPGSLILISGPINSSKYYTFQALLNQLQTKPVSVISLEESFQLNGPKINQINLNNLPGTTLKTLLPTVLSQDADYLIITDLINVNDFNLVLKAAAKGQKIIAGIPEKDIKNSLKKLQQPEIDPYLFALTVRLIINQKPLRLINPELKTKTSNTEAETLLKTIGKHLKDSDLESLSNNNLPEVWQFNKNHVFYQELHSQQKSSWSPEPIQAMELLEIDETLAQLIANKTALPELQKIIFQRGFISLIRDSFLKSKLGVISLKEVIKLIKEDSLF